MSRRRKKNDSPVQTVFLILVAIVVMAAAIYVVVGIVGKIRSDYQRLESNTREESTMETIEIEEEESLGWNETDEGWIYLVDEETRAADQWMEIDGFLYSFDENGIMRTGEWKNEGQIYTLHDTKGYLKEIQTDLNYVPADTGEDLDSLVRTNAFWCYLDSEDTGLFKTILYRRTVENKVMPLGDEESPERTTRYSMRTYGDYVYYLPKVSESSLPELSDSDRGLCDVLVRMIPGQKTKEIIAENVDGYLVLDETIYYSQNGEIYSVKSGTEVPVGASQYLVTLKNEMLYLEDALGNAVSAEGGSVAVEDRRYTIADDGQIEDIERNEVTLDGVTYHLRGSGTQGAVYARDSGGDRALIREAYGVQSFCIVDNKIYYSAYVDKTSEGEWYSRIYSADLDGGQKEAISGLFAGAIGNMYYFEGDGSIYGEYHPAIWKQAYGTIVSIGRDGSLRRIQDESARTGRSASGNDVLKLAAVQDGKIYCLWQDCVWSAQTGITDVKWSKGVELDASSAEAVATIDAMPEETQSQTQEETTAAVIISPIGGESAGAGENVPVSPLNPTQESKQEVVIGTDAPSAETQETKPAETSPSSGAVTIIPLQ